MSKREFKWEGATIWNISLSATTDRLMVNLYIPIDSETELTLAEATKLIDKAKFNVRLVQVEDVPKA